MDKRVVFVSAIVLALAFGSAYGDVGWNYPPFEMELDSGYVDQDGWGIALFWDPQTLLTLGYMFQDVGIGPGPGVAVGAQSGYIVETQTTGTGTQTVYVSGSQVSVVSGDGIAWVDSDMYVLTWQSQP